MARPVDIERSANSAHLEWIGSTEQDPLYILMQREATEDGADSPEDNAVYYFNQSSLTKTSNSSFN